MFNNFVRLSSVIPKNVWNKILNIFDLFFAKESVKNHSQKLFWHLEAIEEALYLKRACYHIDQTIEYQFPTVWQFGNILKTIVELISIDCYGNDYRFEKNLIVQLYKKTSNLSKKYIHLEKNLFDSSRRHIFRKSLKVKLASKNS